MDIIKLKKANCKNCYKCIRNCPVKCIEMKNGRANILETECTMCGICVHACPQNAISVCKEIDTIKEFIQNGEEIYVSLAPSFTSSFEMEDPLQMVTALNKLGFAHVQDTAVGVSLVAKAYKEHYEKMKEKEPHPKNYMITSSCSSVNRLIRIHYPEMVPYLAPYLSPMLAHGKYLKEKYGKDIKVVMIGPCIAKKEEAQEDPNGYIDAVLTYEELGSWLLIEGITLKELPPTEMIPFDYDNNIRIYSMPGGILKSVFQEIPEENRNMIVANGPKEVADVLEYLKKTETTEPLFVEMRSCDGGCINGPAVYRSRKNRNKFINKELLLKYADTEQKDPMIKGQRDEIAAQIDVRQTFQDIAVRNPMPTEEEINEILMKTGKNSPKDMLNCGSCGYNTCREKAIAVYQGRAELRMCLPYMREKAESLSSVILYSSPDAIVAADYDLVIHEFNQSAERLFGFERTEAIGKEVYEIMDDIYFKQALETGKNITEAPYILDDGETITKQSVIQLKEHNLIVALITDVTNEIHQKEKLQKLKAQTVDTAQKVIDKQMIVAQQIASLLGETTAETKVILTRLKKLSEEGDEIL